ncbi:MAG: class I SAM-dependent methyltransferase [Nitrospirota bacterium]
MQRNTACYLCKSEELLVRPGSVRDNALLEIYECSACGLVFLSSFDHIHSGFYENSGMHGEKPDRETWMRETAVDDERRFNVLRGSLEGRSVLDFGCGTGGFLLKAREVAAKVAGVEREHSLKPWFHNQKLDVFSSLEDVDGNFDIITLFHVLEHIPDPRTVLSTLGTKLNKNGIIIVEVPNANDALLTLYKSSSFSRFTYWSCHLFLFSQSTLPVLAEQSGLSVNYVKQIQRYPLSNHLYWLAHGKPGGHQTWSYLDSPELTNSYEKQLANIGACDTILASFSRTHPGVHH